MAIRPSFQRRHYRAVADIIAKARKRPNDSVAETIGDIEQDFADLFRSDNPRFHAGRFHQACDPDRLTIGDVFTAYRDCLERRRQS